MTDDTKSDKDMHKSGWYRQDRMCLETNLSPAKKN